MAEPIRVQRIDHITIVVKDMAVSRRFYEDTLGMQEVPRPGFAFPGLWFQAGTTQVHLIGEHPESGPPGTYLPENCSLSRTRHFAFEVENAFAAHDRLNELGIEIVAGPKYRPDGPIQLYIFDPDQNLVELFSMQ